MNHQARYRPDIDGLRAIAVGVVLAYHGFPQLLPGGFVGVDVFFVISGYLISGIILGGLRDARFSLLGFYARRIRRIFPALGLVLAAVMAIGWIYLYADDYARVSRHVAAGAAFYSNFALWWESSYFDVAASLKPLLHLWSLGVEEQFYLAWPLILMVASRWRRGPIGATFLFGAASFAIALWTVRIDPTAAFFAPWARFWELLAGAVLACVEADTALSDRWNRAISPALRNIGAVLGLAAIVGGVMVIDTTRVFPGLWVLLPVVGTWLLLAAGSGAVINRTLLSWPIVVGVGLISYPLYLWHWPLLSLAQLLNGSVPPAPVRALLLAASGLLAWATYRLIERPVRFGAGSRSIVPVLVTAMSLVLAAGLVVSQRQGFIDRPINRGDAARLVEYYDRMHEHGLGAAYRDECDFLDWQSKRVRDAVSPTCLARGRAHTLMLWGDSFAQALSLGLRENLPPGTSLAQVATSVCRAQTEDFETSVEDHRCEKADIYAMRVITELRPDAVILAQTGEHEETDWAKLTGKILTLGAGRVIVVGPSPTWDPSLPRVYAENHLQDHAEYVSIGLYADRFRIDREIRARVSDLPHVSYVSLLDSLCRDGGCLGPVPGEGPLDLMAVDYGHLSPKGSSYIGRIIWKPYFESLTE